MEPYLLINPFAVPPEDDAAFLAQWTRIARFMRTQPGFVTTTLHKSGTAGAAFRYVNIARWESREAFETAVGTPQFAAMHQAIANFPNYPALYQAECTIDRED